MLVFGGVHPIIIYSNHPIWCSNIFGLRCVKGPNRCPNGPIMVTCFYVMGNKTRSYMTEPSWIKRNPTWRKKLWSMLNYACVLFVRGVSWIRKWKNCKLGKVSYRYHNKLYISSCFGLFRISTSQECLDIWNSSNLDPGGVEGCQWPPSTDVSKFGFRLPSKIVCNFAVDQSCSVTSCLLVFYALLFQLFNFVNPIPEEFERAATWCWKSFVQELPQVNAPALPRVSGIDRVSWVEMLGIWWESQVLYT